MGEARKPEPTPEDKPIEIPKYGLPKWFALKGPEPGWLVSHWGLIFGVVGAVIVFLNTVVAKNIESVNTVEWVNAAVAWLSSIALWLQGRQKHVTAVANWRAQVRAEEKAKDNPPT